MTQIPPPQQPLQYATPTAPVMNLRELATKQRTLMYCLLAYILLVVAQFAVPADAGAVKVVIALLTFVVAIAAAVFVFMIAIQLYGTGAGVALGICTLIPLVGLIILLVVNGKATNVLRQHGVKVGLMGADPSTIPPQPGM